MPADSAARKLISEWYRKLGRRGGAARARKIGKTRRIEIATIASAAAKRARIKRKKAAKK